jgi:hypothetical protein
MVINIKRAASFAFETDPSHRAVRKRYVTNYILYMIGFTLKVSIIISPDDSFLPGQDAAQRQVRFCRTASLMRNRRRTDIELHEPLMR